MIKTLTVAGLMMVASQGAFASGKFHDQIRAAVQAIRNDATIEASNKAEAAIAKAFSTSLDEAVLFLSKQTDGKMYRLHSNTKYNGEVKDPKDIEVYTRLFDAVQGDAKEFDTEMPNSSGEMFKWKVTAVDANSIIVCRHG